MKAMTITGLPARVAALMAAVVALTALELRATPIMTETWDSGTVNGWTSTGDATLGNPGTYLSISLPAETAPVPGTDIVQTGPGAASGLTGDYIAAGVHSVNFRFLAQDYAPDTLALYFASPTHNWTLALDPATVSVGSWTSYTVSLDYTAGWMGGPGADAAAFASDLASIDTIGISIGRNYGACANPPAQIYGLDDFTANVATPEPETYVLLMAALAPLLVVYRKLRVGRI